MKLSFGRAGLTASVMSLFIYLIGSPGFAQMPDSKAPDFTLNDVLGNKVSLSAFRGSVTILNFWATWCGPCKAEMPSLNNLYLEFKDKGLAVVAVSIDTSEKPVLSFISQKKLAFPVLMDKNKEVYFDDYAGMGLPETFIIDRKGILIEKLMGEQEWDSPKTKERILKYLTGR
ncbi:MAG: TlpA disulfide reductase family protein [Dissulfurispiraceae bacterium]